MHITAGSDCACQLISDAFGIGLQISGLEASELSALFRVDAQRPDWRRVGTRGPLRAGLRKDDDIIDSPGPTQALALSGGQVRLNSHGPGEATLHADPTADLHLLPPPLNLLLSQQWAREGLFPLHAAALRWRGQGVLILGDRGSGKSSVVLAALSRGAEIISDDWLLVGAAQETFRAERLREFLMFRSGLPWDAFADDLRDASRPGPDGRHVVPIVESDRYPVWSRIDRCLVLQVPGREQRDETSRAVPIHQAKGLAELVSATMPLLLTAPFVHERDRLMRAFQALAQQVPMQAAWTGLDLIGRPEATLDRLLDPEHSP